MAMEFSNTQRENVRMLTLKRWNVPQTTSIFSSNSLNCNRFGEFVSFQSHHFIDILPPQSSISDSYAILSDYRKAQNNIELDEIHTVQSITIIGNDNMFWDVPPDVLYITFIQLRNSVQWEYQKLNEEISQIIKDACKSALSSKHKPEWALYYTLDFCDLILFTKNISIQTYHDILWKLALLREGKTQAIRDTFTLYSFRYKFLIDSYKSIDSGLPISWIDQVALSINLSIQSIDVWTRLKTKLDNLKVPYNLFRLPGRYDINITTEVLDSTTVLNVIRAIDVCCAGDSDTSFGGYKIQLMTDPWNGNLKGSKNARQDRKFEFAASKLMTSLCERYCQVDTTATEYINETRKSLIGLLKNGFSEEFVLSVFLSFVSFLKISLEGYNAQKTDVSYFNQHIYPSMDKMKRGYFSALNTLALCTMHSERQFIQAPAFNAMYFDVPPKLLTLYSALSFSIVEKLKDTAEPPYRFVICPDYRQDIYVDPLDAPCRSDTSEHLAVVYLCEKDFYNPQKAVYLLSHEIAHYVGKRKREERAQHIFCTISYILLCQTSLLRFVSNYHAIESEKSLLSVLAISLGNYMFAKFKQSNITRTRGIEYQLIDVANHLQRIEYGFSYFEDPKTRSQIIENWITSLKESIPTNTTAKKEFTSAIKHQQIKLASNSLFSKNSDAIYDFFARNCAAKVNDIKLQLHANSSKMQFELFSTLCENSIQAYSEAYADLRMIEISGNLLKLSEYEKLLGTIPNIQTSIRHDAVCRTVYPGVSNSWIPHTKDFPNKCKALDIELIAITKHIADYLKGCHKNKVASKDVINTLQVFSSDDLNNQICFIQRTIASYRKQLTRYCELNI